MQELQVPTRRIAVELVTDAGRRMRGALFAPESRYPMGQAEFVHMLLNDDRAFLPFRPDDGTEGGALYNKRHMARIRLLDTSEPGPLELAGDREAACRLELVDGTTIQGWLAVETRWSASRLLDKLNQTERYLPVVTTEGVEFVQRDHVVRVE